MSEVDLTAAERLRIDELYEVVQSGTYFQLLGVAPDADARAVQAAYYEMSRTWHPDRFFRRDLGQYRERLETVFASMTKAYRILTNEGDRLRYHRELEEAGHKLARPKRGSPADPVSVSPDRTVSPDRSVSPDRTVSPDRSVSPDRTVSTAGRAPAPPPPPPAPAVHEVSMGGRSTRPSPSPSAAPRAASPPPAGAAPPRPSADPSRPSAPPGRPGVPPRPAAAPASSRAAPNPLVNAMREQVRERLERARRYYVTGKEDFDKGNYVKASGAFKLALELDPKNELYLKAEEEASAKARTSQVDHFLKQARDASENMQEAAAIDAYKRALEYEPDDPVAYFKVAKWVLDKENDQRKAVMLFRKAIERKPDSSEYRLALADLYLTLNLELNARREYQAVLERDKKNERAKAALARLR